MELSQADQLAQEIQLLLAMACSRIAVVGSIRRRRPFPHDIDLLCIPNNQGRFLMALNTIGEKVKEGPKIATRRYKGQQVDIYIATPETWYTLLLIRTGSKQHNIWLTTLAKGMGLTLHADGSGLLPRGVMGPRLAGESEESFFAVLRLPYRTPQQREL